MPNTVVASRADRLGNRLLTMMSARDFAIKIDANLVINWPSSSFSYDSSNDYYDFFELFDPVQFEVHEKRVSITSESHDALIRRSLVDCAFDLFKHPPKKIDYFAFENRNFLFRSPKDYEFVEGEDQSINKTSYGVTFFQSLQFNQTVDACLRDILASLPTCSSLSLHIRRGDLIPMIQEFGKGIDESDVRKAITRVASLFSTKYAPLEAYEETVKTYGSDRPVLLFSDDPTMFGQLSKRCRNTIIDVSSLVQGYGLSAVQAAFVEILVMSKTMSIVSTGSSFSHIACYIGNIRRRRVSKYIRPDHLLRDLNALCESNAYKDLVMYEVMRVTTNRMPEGSGRRAAFIAALETLKRERFAGCSP